MSDGDDRNEDSAAERERALAERAADAALGFTRRSRVDEIAQELSGTLAHLAESGSMRDIMRTIDPLGVALAEGGIGRIGKLTQPYESSCARPAGWPTQSRAHAAHSPAR